MLPVAYDRVAAGFILPPTKFRAKIFSVKNFLGRPNKSRGAPVSLAETQSRER
jgi:hypothetical protein